MTQNNDNIPWGCIGTVLAALIIGTVTLIVALPSFVPLIPSKVTIQNELLLPISVYINSSYQGELNAQTSDSFILDHIPATVEIALVRTRKSDGSYWGENLEALFVRVESGDFIVVKNQLGDEFYFYPLLYNNSNENCTINIDDGYTTEQYVGIIEAGQQGISMGYYRLYSNSNVTLYCGDSTTWWGRRNGEGNQIFVQPNSGLLVLTLGQ